MRGKRGQFYILVALLLIAYAFTLLGRDVSARKPTDTFSLLYEGFLLESSPVINNAIFSEENLTSSFEAFAQSFLAYSKSVAPSFRLAYFLKSGNTLAVGNHLDEPIALTVGGVSRQIEQGQLLHVSAGSANFSVSGISYSFIFGDELQLRAIFRMEQELATRVYVR